MSNDLNKNIPSIEDYKALAEKIVYRRPKDPLVSVPAEFNRQKLNAILWSEQLKKLANGK